MRVSVYLSVPKDLSVSTDEPLWFSFTVGLLIGYEIFCYLIITNKSGFGFRLFSTLFIFLKNQLYSP